MNRTLATCILVVSAGVVICVSAYAPRWLNDQNKFLADFMNYNLLSILGVILAITLASASSMHLKFNDIEERLKRRILQDSRREIESSTRWLIWIFVAAILLVVVKPILASHSVGVALLNGSGLLLLLFDLLILADFTFAIFSISPIIPDEDQDNQLN